LLDAGLARSVLLVTADGHRSALFDRAAKANGLPADLFLSIHHDSVPDRFLQHWEYEGSRHPFSDRFKGHSLVVSYEHGDVRVSAAVTDAVAAFCALRAPRIQPAAILQRATSAHRP